MKLQTLGLLLTTSLPYLFQINNTVITENNHSNKLNNLKNTKMKSQTQYEVSGDEKNLMSNLGITPNKLVYYSNLWLKNTPPISNKNEFNTLVYKSNLLFGGFISSTDDPYNAFVIPPNSKTDLKSVSIQYIDGNYYSPTPGIQNLEIHWLIEYSYFVMTSSNPQNEPKIINKPITLPFVLNFNLKKHSLFFNMDSGASEYFLKYGQIKDKTFNTDTIQEYWDKWKKDAEQSKKWEAIINNSIKDETNFSGSILNDKMKNFVFDDSKYMEDMLYYDYHGRYNSTGSIVVNYKFNNEDGIFDQTATKGSPSSIDSTDYHSLQIAQGEDMFITSFLDPKTFDLLYSSSRADISGEFSGFDIDFENPALNFISYSPKSTVKTHGVWFEGSFSPHVYSGFQLFWKDLIDGFKGSPGEIIFAVLSFIASFA